MAKKRKQAKQSRAWAPRIRGDKTEIFTCRLLSKTRWALEAAAQRNRRTLGAEIGHLLEFALSCQTRTHALMALVAEAINSLVKMRGREWDKKSMPPPKWTRSKTANWQKDPYVHAQAHEAVRAAFRLVQPKGFPPDPGKAFDRGGAGQGRFAFEALWNELRSLPDKPRKLTARQRRLLVLKVGLQPLLNSVELWGTTGRQLRRMPLPLSEKELREYRDLSRKRFDDEALTVREEKRLTELQGKFPKPNAEAA